MYTDNVENSTVKKMTQFEAAACLKRSNYFVNSWGGGDLGCCSPPGYGLKVARNSFHFPQTSFTNSFPNTVWFIVSV